MKKPDDVTGIVGTTRWALGQAWRDFLSIYYANNPFWRWLKSGALLFLGLCVWAGAAVLLSVRPEWTFLYVIMAYGFLLILWGPLTHLAVVPSILRLRRSASHPVSRFVARNGSKINITIFLSLVLALAVAQPPIMLLEFGAISSGDEPTVDGDVECEGPVDGMITCDVHDPQNIDQVVVVVQGSVVAADQEPPFELTFSADQARQVNGAAEFAVEFRNADGSIERREIHRVGE